MGHQDDLPPSGQLEVQSTRTAWEQRWYGSAPPHWALQLLSQLYRAGVGLRNWAFDAGLLPTHSLAPAKVVSVGNLTVGGTGKTPTVIYLARWAAACGHTVAVLTRGYGRRGRALLRLDRDSLLPADQVGDEPRMIAQACPPGVTVWVGRNRVHAGQRAVQHTRASFVILDDGFQHRYLRRDVDLVIVDDEVGFGNGQLLPAGPLREPVHSMQRAQLVGRRVAAPGGTPRSGEYLFRLKPRAWVSSTHGEELALDELRGAPLLAFAGIARPERFFATLRSLGLPTVSTQAFPDHHRYSTGELEALTQQALARGARLVTTEKDLQRLPADFPALALSVRLELLLGLPLLARSLGLDEQLAPPPIARGA